MININEGQISIKGTEQEILEETLALVYSLRTSMKNEGNFLLCAALDMGLSEILIDEFDDKVTDFRIISNRKYMDESHSKTNNIKDIVDDFVNNIINDIVKEREENNGN